MFAIWVSWPVYLHPQPRVSSLTVSVSWKMKKKPVDWGWVVKVHSIEGTQKGFTEVKNNFILHSVVYTYFNISILI